MHMEPWMKLVLIKPWTYLVEKSWIFVDWISNKVNGTMSIVGGTMNSIYVTMGIVGGTMNSIYVTMGIVGGIMSNGHERVKQYKEPWTKFMEN